MVVQQGSGGGAPVRVADIAEVRDSTIDQSNVVRVGGVRGVYLRVLKQPSANTIAAVDAVRAALPTLRGVPAGVRLSISFDQSSYIRAAVKSLEHEAIQGGLFAIVVILIFLLSLRATGIVAVAIPLSIVATFILLYFAGQTLNVFTLGGLALGVGRLVDDSIVELENIHRHLGEQKSRKTAVLLAAQEVAMPILVSTITTIVVFFPVLFLSGVARSLFIPLAMTISFALMMSFFVSRTVTPLLCMYWLRPPAHDLDTRRGLIGSIARGLERMDQAYARLLRVLLRHRLATVLVIVGLCASTIPLYFKIGSEFFPSSDESQFTLTFKTPIGTRVERTEQVAQRLEGVINGAIGAKAGEKTGKGSLYTTMISDLGLPGGRTALFTSNTGPHVGNLQVNLLPKLQRDISDVQIVDKLRAALREGFPGIQSFFFYRRHRQAHPQLWRARSDRCGDPGLRPRRRGAVRAQAVCQDAGGTRCRRQAAADRRADHPRGELSRARYPGRSRKSGRAGAKRAAGGADGAGELGRKLAVCAGALHRSKDRQRVLYQRAHGRCVSQQGLGPG